MNKKRRISISVKMDLLLVSMILLVSAGLVAISYRVYSNRVNRLYYSQVERAANEAVGEIIPEMVINFWNEVNSDEFRTVRAEAVAANDENIIRAWMTARPTFILSNTVEGQDAIEMMTEEEILSWGSLWGDYEYMLRALRESMAYFDITVAYIQHDEDGVSWNLVDPVEDLFYIGTAEEPIDAFKGFGDNVYISPTIYHSAYGWLCTAIVPIIYGRDQIAVGTVGVDTDMNRIIESRSHYLMNSGMFVLGITILGILLSLVITRRIVIKPLQLHPMSGEVLVLRTMTTAVAFQNGAEIRIAIIDRFLQRNFLTVFVQYSHIKSE